jgi:hypothetical protein
LAANRNGPKLKRGRRIRSDPFKLNTRAEIHIFGSAPPLVPFFILLSPAWDFDIPVVAPLCALDLLIFAGGEVPSCVAAGASGAAGAGLVCADAILPAESANAAAHTEVKTIFRI